MAVLGDEALLGRVLDDRYEIHERIARGGMASVFTATDRRLDRTVAVKVMHRGLGDDAEFTERFVREAKSAAKLNHPNVVSVFDQGSDGDATYLVMEYVPGQTLRDIMRDECPMSPHRALQLLEPVMEALSAAHAAKIIHRDVKPENVLIAPDGDVKVADFGLARAVSAATTATGGTLIGTVSYLAPEIVLNEGADARSDVYACGAILYEMLTGIKPHSGETPIQVAYKHVHDDIGRPSALAEGVPPYLDALVARATVRDRDFRSTDARVLLRQLRQVQGAINAGLADDPELTRELMPGAGPDAPRNVGADVSAPVAVDFNNSTTADTEATQTVGVSEATRQWSNDVVGAKAGAVTGGLQAEMSAEDYRELKKQTPRSRRGTILLVLALAAAVIAASIGWYVGVGRYTDAPQLVGLSQAEAKADAEAAGFEFEVGERRFDETAPLGTVMETDPGPGERILPGGVITAIVSQGKERYEIPNLKGKTVEQATRILEALNLTVGDTSRAFNTSVKSGAVIKAADFKVGDQVKRDTVIDLVLSKGRRPIDVENYQGKTETEATEALTKAGFKVDVERVFNDSVTEGVVITQTPNGGTKFKNDTIVLTVSKGPTLIDVPDVRGKRANEARTILENAGFKVDTPNFEFGNFRVRSQSPDANTKQPPGSTIVISQFPREDD